MADYVCYGFEEVVVRRKSYGERVILGAPLLLFIVIPGVMRKVTKGNVHVSLPLCSLNWYAKCMVGGWE